MDKIFWTWCVACAAATGWALDEWAKELRDER